jgi:hypothetical protein
MMSNKEIKVGQLVRIIGHTGYAGKIGICLKPHALTYSLYNHAIYIFLLEDEQQAIFSNLEVEVLQ